VRFRGAPGAGTRYCQAMGRRKMLKRFEEEKKDIWPAPSPPPRLRRGSCVEEVRHLP